MITGRGLNLRRVLERARNGSEDRVRTLLARHRLDAPPVPPDLGLPWLARQCVELTLDEFDAVVAITGKEGVSKSMLALEFVLEVSKLTGRPWAFRDLCYTGREVLEAYQRAKTSVPIWYDEGTRDLLAGDTFDLDQDAVVRGLTLLREKGAIFVICLPSIFLLAKKLRGRRVTFWVHIESRGTRRRPAPSVALLHERDEALRYRNDDALGLSRSLRCPRITYEPLPEGDSNLRAYKKLKRGNLDGWVSETLERMNLRDMKAANAEAKERRAAERNAREPPDETDK